MRRWYGMLFVLALCLLPGTARAAEPLAYDGYIVKIDTGPRLFSADAPSLETLYAPAGLYRADDAAAVERLAEEGILLYAEPDHLVTLGEVPNDPHYSAGDQWYLSDLGMEYAWERGVTGAGVRVGVIDSGLFPGHQDFAGVSILPGGNYTGASGTGDTYGHGTFVSGIIAAAAGNGIGIAGMAPAVELVPLKCFQGRNGSLSAIVSAIYAGVDDFHCQILNMSFGISSDDTPLREAVQYAASAGVVLTAAVGNDGAGTSTLSYPAAYPEVIGVGALDENGQVAPFSTRNESVAISAPGASVWSLSYLYPNAYGKSRGTSYAVPMVTAAAALALSLRPDLDRETLADLMTGTAWDLGEPGYDISYGWGALHVGRFLAAVRGDLAYQAVSASEQMREDALMLLASYRQDGRLLDVQTVEQGNAFQARTVEDAAAWKLLALDRKRLVPLRPALRLYGIP